MIAAGAIVFVLLEFAIQRTRIGKLMQAVASDPWMASMLGINVPALLTVSVVASFALAGFAGGLLAPFQSVDLTIGGSYLLLALLLGLVALAAAISAPVWANPGLLFIAGLIVIQSLFAISWNVLFGYAGLASFGHAGFFGIGADCAGAMLRFTTGVPFPLTLLIASALGAAVAWLIGVVALRRLSGIFLAVLTVALSEMLRLIISYARFLGAEDGLANILRPRIDLGFVLLDLTSAVAYYWFLLAAAALATAALWWLLHSRYGRIFQIIRQDAKRAAFLGINVARYRGAGLASSAWHAWRPSAAVVEEARQLLADLGLAKLRDEEARFLSHGDKKRLEIALALAQQPRILMLDDPTEGLAPVIVEQMARDVLDVCARDKVALLLSEQNIWFARRCTEYVYVLATGRIVFEGSWAQFDAAGEEAKKYLAV